MCEIILAVMGLAVAYRTGQLIRVLLERHRMIK